MCEKARNNRTVDNINFLWTSKIFFIFKRIIIQDSGIYFITPWSIVSNVLKIFVLSSNRLVAHIWFNSKRFTKRKFYSDEGYYNFIPYSMLITKWKWHVMLQHRDIINTYLNNALVFYNKKVLAFCGGRYVTSYNILKNKIPFERKVA